MNKKFQIIVADPPWGAFKDTLKMSDTARGAAANYNTMSMLEIKQLPIKNIADPSGALLALWIPSSLLQEGLDIMKEWGFKHKQTYVWVKTKKVPLGKLFDISYNFVTKILARGYVKEKKSELIKELLSFKLSDLLSFGMGRLFRQTHEICLIGINNNKIYKQLSNKSQRSVSFAENLKHSAKPESLQDSLEIMFPSANKLELFARRQKPNWICVGNEAPATLGEDILVSINGL